MNTGNSALLVIDVQQAIFKRSTPVYQAEAMLANINALVQKAHLAGAPVIYVQHSSPHMPEGSQEWQLHPKMQPQAGDLHIRKQHGNAFLETTLEDELQARAVGTIVACGLVTQGCVRATCLGGLAYGYAVTLASDAHSTYSKGAAKVIQRWERELAEAGVSIKNTGGITF